MAELDRLLDGEFFYQYACHKIVDIPRDYVKNIMIFKHGKIADGQRVGDQGAYPPPVRSPVIKDLKGQRSSPHILYPMEHGRIFEKAVPPLLSGDPHSILYISSIRI
ncbi:Uncharacterised protein [uncultured Blautia sp.]|nr:Uncharacterised protein [uncultured Blautia sp.]